MIEHTKAERAAYDANEAKRLHGPTGESEPVAEKPRWEREKGIPARWRKQWMGYSETVELPIALEAAIAEEARRDAEAFSTRTALRAELVEQAFVAGSEWALEQYRELLEAAERLSNSGAFRPTSAYEQAIADVMRAYRKLAAAAALNEEGGE